MSHSSDEKKFRLLMNQYGDCLYWHIRRTKVNHPQRGVYIHQGKKIVVR